MLPFSSNVCNSVITVFLKLALTQWTQLTESATELPNSSDSLEQSGLPPLENGCLFPVFFATLWPPFFLEHFFTHGEWSLKCWLQNNATQAISWNIRSLSSPTCLPFAGNFRSSIATVFLKLSLTPSEWSLKGCLQNDRTRANPYNSQVSLLSKMAALSQYHLQQYSCHFFLEHYLTHVECSLKDWLQNG